MNKLGRPTEYDESFNQKIDEYLESCKDITEDWVKTDGKASTTYEKVIDVDLPTIEGLSQFLNVSRRSIFEWKDKYPIFSHSLEKINIEQKKRLINMSLAGKYNSTIAKLILSANHDMREKTETDVTSGGKSIGGFNFIKNGGKAE